MATETQIQAIQEYLYIHDNPNVETHMKLYYKAAARGNPMLYTNTLTWLEKDYYDLYREGLIQ